MLNPVIPKSALRFAARKLGVKVPPIYFRFLANADGQYSVAKGYIDLDKTLTGEKLIRIFFHEMAHHWQAARGWLKYSNQNLLWHGKACGGPEYSLPWEVHARSVEDLLFKEYKATSVPSRSKPGK